MCALCQQRSIGFPIHVLVLTSTRLSTKEPFRFELLMSVLPLSLLFPFWLNYASALFISNSNVSLSLLSVHVDEQYAARPLSGQYDTRGRYLT